MIVATTCLICGSRDLVSTPATVAPFIRARCGIEAPDLNRLYCPACDFAFFDQRYSDTETADLYRDYRGEAYNALREACEPGWGEIAASHADRGNPYHATRRAHLADLLAAWGVAPSRILDYGGEEDAWLAKGAFPLAKVQNYDISFDAAKPSEPCFDLVLCAHVLEHIAFPVPFLREVAGFLAPGGRLYLEIPVEDTRLEATLIPGHPLNRMHEHISQFSPSALERLVARCGLAPLRVRNFRNPFFRATALLASRAPEGPGEAPVREDLEAAEAPVLGGALARLHAQGLRWSEAGTRLVIHPAGSFTLELLAYTAVGRAKVLALSDASPRLQSTTLMGVPVVDPRRIPELAPDMVLIASPAHEDVIARELGWLAGTGIRVIRASSYL